MTQQVIRERWIDTFKGLAIISVILSHTWSPVARYLFLFEIPAFFFIYGYSSNFSNYSFDEFIKKRAKRLLVPFFGFNLFFILQHFFTHKLSLSHFFYTSEVGKQFSLLSSFNGLLTMTKLEQVAAPTWFLVVLFFASVVTYILLKVEEKYQVNRFQLLAILLGLHLGFKVLNYQFAFFLDLVPLASLFLLLGQSARDRLVEMNVLQHSAWILVVCIYLFHLQQQYLPMIDFPGRIFDPLPVILLTSLLGISFLYSVSKILDKLPIIANYTAYVGKKSLWLLSIHYFGFKVFHLLAYIFGFLPVYTAQFLAPYEIQHYWLPFTVWVVIFCLYAEFIYRKAYLFVKKRVQLIIKKYEK